jgi:hypothetical protein
MVALGGVLNLAAVLLLTFAGPPARTPPQASGSTHSPHGNLNIPCQNCHTANAWTPIRAVPEFDHNQTRYPLRGMHQSVICSQCHVKPIFSNVGQRCQDCHADIHKRQLGANCEQCHTVRGWMVSLQQVQQHNNRFPLTGAHAAVDCDSCHKGAANSKFQTMPTDCYSCHASDYKRASSPNHLTAKFSITCEQCHSTDNWMGAKFDHSAVGFPLTGGHAMPPRQCADCHINNNYNLTTTSCVSCHLKDFRGTTNPNHVTANFSQTCQQCHNTTSWLDAAFNHNTTGFSLTGMHTVPPRQCTDCHVNNNYNLTVTTCVSCHLKDFQGTTNPNHVSQNFPQTCEQCHSTTSWLNATFNHNSTGFPLTGSHTAPPRQCTDCHVNNNYTITNTACSSCHMKDYTNALTPVAHVAAGFPTSCETCHDTVLWTDGKFDHNTTGFSLTGSHTVPPRQCADCHINNNYTLNSTACVTCHLNNFNSTTNPNHRTSGFPQQCEICHDTVAWTNSTFNHNNTTFPLTGLHTVPPRQCTDCHVNSNYTTLPIVCIGCHQTDYNKTANPGHAAQPQFFPTTCQNCHSTSTWLNASFNHAQYTPFPTTHGGANNVCSTCHTNSNDYSIFQCTNCHLKTDTDPRHSGVKGYVYNSINCYQCHQSARGGG